MFTGPKNVSDLYKLFGSMLAFLLGVDQVSFITIPPHLDHLLRGTFIQPEKRDIAVMHRPHRGRCGDRGHLVAGIMKSLSQGSHFRDKAIGVMVIDDKCKSG